jgi:hypothetical protein
MMNGIAYATLANISGHGGSSASLLTRVFLVLICAALLILLYALRGHLVLQLGVGLPALGITTYFVLRAQLAGGFEAPQRTYVIQKRQQVASPGRNKVLPAHSRHWMNRKTSVILPRLLTAWPCEIF